MKSTKKETNKDLKNKSHQNKILLILSIILFLIIGIMLLLPTSSEKKTSDPVSTDPTVKLYLSPSSETVNIDKTVTLDVYMDSVVKEVTGIQADINYPAQDLEYQSIDYTGSAFDVQLQSEGGNGTINIARGSFTPKKGVQKVATINLRTLSINSNAELNFAQSSSIAEANSAIDILSDINNIGATLNIE